VDLFILDNSDVIWRYISEKHQILVKVEEDPNRQKIFAAMVAASAAASSQNPANNQMLSAESSDRMET
jgi:hypothetical protein